MQLGLPFPIAGEQIFSLTLPNEARVVAKPDAPGFQSRLKNSVNFLVSNTHSQRLSCAHADVPTEYHEHVSRANRSPTMPVELQIIRASEFVCLDANEQLDFASSKQALQTLAHACRKRGLDRALLDLRAHPIPDKPLFTPTQLAALVGTFQAAGFGRQHRLAILYKTDPHGGVRTFAFIGRIQHLQVRAFDDFEAAFHWLSEQPSSGARENEIPVPIKQRPRTAQKISVRASATAPARATARPARSAAHKHR